MHDLENNNKFFQNEEKKIECKIWKEKQWIVG